MPPGGARLCATGEVMLGQLVVIAGPDKGRNFALPDGQTVVIGRGEKTETKLKDPQVSRVHCQVQVQGGKALLVDAGGRAGTLINGKRVKEYELNPGDVIQIGATQLQYQLESTPDASTVVVSSPQTPRPAIE